MTAEVVRFAVLGPLEVWRGDRLVPVPAGRARVLLAALLLRANEVVPANRLVEWLWDGAPPNPRRGKATLQMVVTRLRQALGGITVVRTTAGGYLADVPPGALDLDRFRALAADGRYAEALELWRGDPLPDVRSDVLHREAVAPLLEERLAALERRIEVDLAAGRAAELVPELHALTGEHPLRERFWAQLIRALDETDRQAEALAAYDRIRRRLAEELGVDPGATLRELHARVLRGGSRPTRPPTPRQLPPPGDFVGRAAVVSELTALFTGDTGSLPIAVLSGPPGIGKTALAVHVAHAVKSRFPHGQLFADLGGHSPAGAVSVTAVLPRFLRALGVAAEDVPADPLEQSALYRSLTADRRVVVVLDNVRRADDVSPLLPGNPACAVLVTNREGMPALIAAHGARLVTLEPLPSDESIELLRSVLGDVAPSAEPEAAAALADVCAHWPLALRVAAANLASRGRPDLAAYAAELAADDRLDALAIEGEPHFAVRAAFDSSYLGLEPEPRAFFRLLGLVPGGDFSVNAAAALAGGEVRALLARLTRANLVQPQGADRFRIHDLLREYAAARAAAEDAPGIRDRAMSRLLAYFLHTLRNASVPLRWYVAYPGEEVSSPWAEGFADRARALEWCEVEQGNLQALTRWALAAGRYSWAWRFPVAQWPFYDLTKRFSEAIPMYRIAVEAARADGDRTAESYAWQGLGLACSAADRLDDAITAYEHALELRRASGERRAEAASLSALALCHVHRGDHASAIDLLERSRRITHEIGDRRLEGLAFNTLTEALVGSGRAEDAVDASAEAMRLIGDFADPVYEGRFLDNRGRALAAAGRLDEAVETYHRARAKAVEARDHSTVAAVLENLGEALLALGDAAGARARWEEAVALFPPNSAAAARVAGRLAGL